MINTTYVKREHFKESDKFIYKYNIIPLLVIYEILMALFILFLIYVQKYIFIIIFLLVMIGFPFLMNYINQRKLKQTIDLLFSEETDFFTYDYNFESDSFSIKIFINGKNKDYKYDYTNIKRIIETENRIYIFVDKATCFVVDKSGFTYYDKEAFQKLFTGKVKKYIVSTEHNNE